MRRRIDSWMKSHRAQIKDLHFMLFMFWRSRLPVIGLAIVVFFAVLSLIGPWISPYDPVEFNLAERFQPPFSAKHIFGTDEFGRDIYSRILYALSHDLAVGLVVPFLAVSLGLILGLIAGYSEGIIQDIVFRITDAFFAFPLLVSALAISAAIGERSVIVTVIALAVSWWPRYVRLVGSETLSIKKRLFVEASRGLGASGRHIMFHHVLPNCLSSIIVMYTMDVGYAVLMTALLSFLGFGGEPGSPELGVIISEGRNFIQSAPWVIIIPGVVMFVIVMGFSLLGDGLRDVLDPRLRR